MNKKKKKKKIQASHIRTRKDDYSRLWKSIDDNIKVRGNEYVLFDQSTLIIIIIDFSKRY